MQFHENELRLVIDSGSLERGQDYFRRGRVISADATQGGTLVSGMVQGSGRNAYKQLVRLGRDGVGRLQVTGQCSCPVHYNCKHVAAVLLQLAAGMPRPPSRGGDLPRELSIWLDRLRAAGKSDERAASPERLLYLLDLNANFAGSYLQVDTVKTRRLKDGGYGKESRFTAGASSTASFLFPADRDILQLIDTDHGLGAGTYVLRGALGDRALAAMVETGRCHWQSSEEPALRTGPPIVSPLVWELENDGTQTVRVQNAPGASLLLPLSPPWYLDLSDGVCGPVDTGLDDALAEALAAAPPVPVEQADNLARALEASFPDETIPAPVEIETERRDDVPPVPRLLLRSEKNATYGLPGQEVWDDWLELSFDYAGIRVHPWDDEPQLAHRAGDTLELILRHVDTEIDCFERLVAYGLVPDEVVSVDDSLWMFHEYGESGWLEFMVEFLPQLRESGWQVDVDPSFRHQLTRTDEWYAELDEEGGQDWFSLELGVDVEGERVNLLPYLAGYLRRLKNSAELEALRALPENEPFLCRLHDGRVLALPVQRVLHFMEVLVELYDPQALDRDQHLKLPRLYSTQLQELGAGDAKLQWHGGEALRAYGEKLRDFAGIQPVSAPAGLQATLRPYQREGLNWLQFLREFELGGILADDMGLGKTIQALAHLLVEKEAGRADRPSLVVAPTSLMFNWRREAERFAPGLKVLTLQGKDRKADFAAIGEHDLVLTTYPLLPRDADALLAHSYHLLILDEAQHIKNPRAKAAETARRLDARQRLCLTGTPLENHLGELWSQFHFLQPGMLGDEKRFRRLFRTPIEKHADEFRQERLVKRIAPFMLRRDKAHVAAELPPKTEIISEVELNGHQRDLYETIRMAMHERVRKEIDSKGIQRSQIVILDALLKLRQVCCDPRLLKMEAARKVKQSAKLDLLGEMLPEMVAEGRRILLFSQFTTMLGLIEQQLGGLGLDYVKLTGQTRDRATPIDRFQNGEVPVFLISLKAGGSGLNLTAADTVIHYDPWWNPAVERQATDRAHRIGQDKSVFVYKLLTRGTVEEKIAAMQAKKQELADALFGGKSGGSTLSAEDLSALFEPLE